MKVGEKVLYNWKECLIIDVNYPIYSLYVEKTGEYVEAHADDISAIPRPIKRTASINAGYERPSYPTFETLKKVQCDVPTRQYPEYDEVFQTCRPCCEPKSNQNNPIGGEGKMNIKKLFGEFGKVNAGEVVLTFDGKVAVRRSGDEYVRYDEEKEQIVNHLSLVLESGSKFFYILPTTEVAKGEIIKFKGGYFQVIEVLDNGSLKAINLAKGTQSTICKETNAFGINFYNKVTSLFKVDGSAQEGFNPLLLTLITDKGGKYEDLLPLMMLGQGGDFAKNPLLLMSLLGDNEGSEMKDLLMLQAFSGAGQGADFASNPLLMMSLIDDGKSDIKDLMMIQAMSGGKGFGEGFNPLMLLALKK